MQDKQNKLDCSNPDMIVVYSDYDHACVASKDGRYTGYDKGDRWEKQACAILSKGGKVIVVNATGDCEDSQIIIDFIDEVVKGDKSLDFTSLGCNGPQFEIKQNRGEPLLCTVSNVHTDVSEFLDD
jgi:hypothetical protein